MLVKDLNIAQRKFYSTLTPSQRKRMMQILTAKTKNKVIKATGVNQEARERMKAKSNSINESGVITNHFQDHLRLK